MRKLILALLVVAIAAPAFASETRLRTLGPMVAPFIEDDANVFKWYATLPSYANLVTITAGYEDVLFYGDDRGWYDDYLYSKFGLTYGLGEDNEYGVIGLWWEESTLGPLWGHNWFVPYSWVEPFHYPLYNKWNVMWGLSLEGLSFGLYFNRADMSSKYEDDTFEYEYHQAYTTLGLGVRFDVGDDMYIDLAGDYTMVGLTYDESGDWGEESVSEDKNSILSIRGRLFYEWSDVVTVVPYFSYLTGDLSYKTDEDWGDFDVWGFKGFHLDLGLGLNLRVNDETLLIVAVKPYGIAKGEPSGTGREIGDNYYKATMFPSFAFGFETDVKRWLTFRAGCDKTFIKWEEARDYVEYEYEAEYTAAPFNWHLGLGFHVGNFDIDVMLNKEVPFSMGYWLTGFQPDWYSGAPIGMISATYHF